MSGAPEKFRALRVHQVNGAINAQIESLALADLCDGDVTIRVTHSSINYKDALAVTGKGRILRRYPLVAGIDLAGVVHASSNASLRVGAAVLVTGCGLSETRDGGYAEFARVPAEHVIPMPAGLDAFSAMAVGTAGFAAALGILRMENNGQAPANGPVVVTGAAGGVGALAIAMLSARGYEVIAVTSKASLHDWLRGLGAKEVWSRDQLGTGNDALTNARWAGVIDNLGGATLARLLAGTKNNGNVASIGLAESSELHASVMPFILRGVNLLGINSSATPLPTRLAVWPRIANDLKPQAIQQIVQRTLVFDELLGAFPAFLANAVHGRTVVKIG